MAKTWVTGICLNDQALEWCSLKEAASRKDSSERQESSVLLDPAAEDAVVGAVRDAAHQLKGDLHVAIPVDQTLIHILELPSDDPEEIAGMVELQLDDIAPFPPEQMYHDFEILTSTGTSSSVAVLAVHRNVVDHLGDAFRDAKLRIERLDVDIFARWQQIVDQHSDASAPGVRLFLLVENGQEILVAAQEGTLLQVRPLAKPDEGEAWGDNVAEEVEISLTALEVDYPGVEPRELHIWHQGGTPNMGDLASTLGIPVKTHSLAQLPSLAEGVAVRGVDADERRMDLVPQEWKDEEAERVAKKKFARTAVAILGTWALVVASLFGLSMYENARVSNLEEKVAELEGPVSSVSLMRSQGASLSQFSDRTFSVLECLREAIVQLPPNVEFSGWSYKKGRGVSIKGSSKDTRPIFDVQ